MRGLIVAVVLILLSPALTYAQPEKTTPRSDVRSSLRHGAWYLSGFSSLTSFGFWANIDTTDGDAEISVQSYNLNLAGGYFVADHIAVGPTARAEFTRAVDPSDNVRTEFESSLGLQGAYFWEPAQSSWVPVARLEAAYERNSTKDDTSIDDGDTTIVAHSVGFGIGVKIFFPSDRATSEAAQAE